MSRVVYDQSELLFRHRASVCAPHRRPSGSSGLYPSRTIDDDSAKTRFWDNRLCSFRTATDAVDDCCLRILYSHHSCCFFYQKICFVWYFDHSSPDFGRISEPDEFWRPESPTQVSRTVMESYAGCKHFWYCGLCFSLSELICFSQNVFREALRSYPSWFRTWENQIGFSRNRVSRQPNLIYGLSRGEMHPDVGCGARKPKPYV